MEETLHIVAAPESTPPIITKRGVRQGDPLDPLMFALMPQRMLERSDTACEEAPRVSYLDDVNIVGKLTPTPARSGACAWTAM